MGKALALVKAKKYCLFAWSYEVGEDKPAVQKYSCYYFIGVGHPSIARLFDEPCTMIDWGNCPYNPNSKKT